MNESVISSGMPMRTGEPDSYFLNPINEADEKWH